MYALKNQNEATSAPYTRVVDNMVIHGGYIRPDALFDMVITDKTKYLVFDLDRTIHFGCNIGELLGWELGAAKTYGLDYMNAIDSKRGDSRFVFDFKRPGKTLLYMLHGAQRWAYPGLFYLFFGKLSYKFGWSRRLIHRLFGAEPIKEVQEIPRLALMHHLSEMPLETVREISRKLWARREVDQVFMPQDFVNLKRKYPNLKIIISSASPQPVLEIARELFDIDEIIYSEIEERDGYLSSPHPQNLFYMLLRKPKRIAPPESLRHNAAGVKIERLLERCPDFLDESVEKVGVTDNSYGEDGEWGNYFTRVVDVNSPSPFSPVVSASSRYPQ